MSVPPKTARRLPKKWHFCQMEPKCPQPCKECWRTLDRRVLQSRKEMLGENRMERA